MSVATPMQKFEEAAYQARCRALLLGHQAPLIVARIYVPEEVTHLTVPPTHKGTMMETIEERWDDHDRFVIEMPKWFDTTFGADIEGIKAKFMQHEENKLNVLMGEVNPIHEHLLPDDAVELIFHDDMAPIDNGGPDEPPINPFHEEL